MANKTFALLVAIFIGVMFSSLAYRVVTLDYEWFGVEEPR